MGEEAESTRQILQLALQLDEKCMETKEKETELVQLIRQLKDYVILDRKDYEKLVQNSSPEKFNESALEARDAQIKLLEQQLAHQEDWVNYWKNKYEKCLEELKKESTR